MFPHGVIACMLRRLTVTSLSIVNIQLCQC